MGILQRPIYDLCWTEIAEKIFADFSKNLKERALSPLRKIRKILVIGLYSWPHCLR